MGVDGDVYKLTTYADWQGQDNENVYFYRIEDTPTAGAAEGLANEFVEEVLNLIVVMQSTDMIYNRIHVVNLFDASDVFEDALAVAGEQACGSLAASTPTFLAQRCGLIRDNARVKNGSKYYGGLCEVNVSGNTVVGLTAAQDALTAKLLETVIAGLTDEFKLVLVKRVRTVIAAPTTLNPDNQKYKYSLPTSQEQMGNLWAYVRDVTWSTAVSHMDSRQLGRGN